MDKQIMGLTAALLLMTSFLMNGCGSSSSTVADTTGPKVSTISIAETDVTSTDAATDIAVDAAIVVTFNEAILESSLTTTADSVTTNNITLTPTAAADGSTDSVTGFALNTDLTQVTLSHGELAPGVAYTLTISNSITDSAGNALTTSELATLSSAAVTGDTSLSLAFTVSSTAGTNTPQATVVVPSFPPAGSSTMTIIFDKAVDSSTLSGNVEVTTAADTATSLVSDLSLASDNVTLTLTLSSGLACSDTFTRYNLTLGADIRSLTGNHAVKPVSDYFTNFDDGFDDSTTQDESDCWVSLKNNGAGTNLTPADTGALVTIDSTTDGKLHLHSSSGVDSATNAGQLAAALAHGIFDAGTNSIAITVKVDSGTGSASADDHFQIALFNFTGTTLADLDTSNSMENQVDLDSFNGDANSGGVDIDNSLNTDCTDTDCFRESNSVYLCITRNSDGTLYESYGVDTGSSFGTANVSYPADSTDGSTTPSISGNMNFLLAIENDGTGDAITYTVDWVRFNISSDTTASCPGFSAVQ